MPKRNLVWIAVGAVIAVLLWQVPRVLLRRDALYSQFSPLLDVRVQVLKHYVEEIEPDVLVRGAIDGMLTRLDPYSEYYEAAEYDQFKSRTEGEFIGIGIWLAKLPTGELVVVSPIEGSPAFHERLRAGDRITAIDGCETDGMTLEESVRLIKGTEGTEVTLTLVRPPSDEPFNRTIVRRVVTMRSVRGWARSPDWKWDYLIDPEYRIGYVRISSFERHTDKDLHTAIQNLLVEHHIRGLIIDLRGNPGGLLESVVEIADRFLTSGRIVSTKGRTTHEQDYDATPERAYPDFAMAVLVNHGSASAAEILTGALRDHGRATVVGERTFGKASVQEVFPVDDGRSAVKLTTGYYYLPKGERIHGLGIVPDIIVELTEEERDELMEAQLAVYSTSPAPETMPSTTAPETEPDATSTAPAPAKRVEILIDRQLAAALEKLREELGEP